MDRIVSDDWAGFKALLDLKEPPFQEMPQATGYNLFFEEGNVRYFFYVSEAADITDYETNYQIDANDTPGGPERPTSVQVGINVKREVTVTGNAIDCPNNSWVTLCSLTVAAGKNVLCERVIVCMEIKTLVRVRLRNITDSINRRVYYVGEFYNGIDDRILFKNKLGGSPKTFELRVKQSSGSTQKMSGVLVARRTR